MKPALYRRLLDDGGFAQEIKPEDVHLYKEHEVAALYLHPPMSNFTYRDIADFERIVGYGVGDAFKTGWVMARTTNEMLGIESVGASNGE